ncbi:MAG TPA: hypothetical protein VIA98_13140 [Allosphingosinicella sp.]|jgi:hypothetical protein
MLIRATDNPLVSWLISRLIELLVGSVLLMLLFGVDTEYSSPVVESFRQSALTVVSLQILSGYLFTTFFVRLKIGNSALLKRSSIVAILFLLHFWFITSWDGGVSNFIKMEKAIYLIPLGMLTAFLAELLPGSSKKTP